jgi:hypothetical protein
LCGRCADDLAGRYVRLIRGAGMAVNRVGYRNGGNQNRSGGSSRKKLCFVRCHLGPQEFRRLLFGDNEIFAPHKSAFSHINLFNYISWLTE